MFSGSGRRHFPSVKMRRGGPCPFGHRTTRNRSGPPTRRYLAAGGFGRLGRQWMSSVERPRQSRVKPGPASRDQCGQPVTHERPQPVASRVASTADHAAKARIARIHSVRPRREFANPATRQRCVQPCAGVLPNAPGNDVRNHGRVQFHLGCSFHACAPVSSSTDFLCGGPSSLSNHFPATLMAVNSQTPTFIEITDH